MKENNDELYFRDYLRANPAVAHEYETLKRSLLPQYEHDRDGYTEAKSAFVEKVMKGAKTNVFRGLSGMPRETCLRE